MKTKLSLGLFLALILTSCQKVENNADNFVVQQTKENTILETEKSEKERIWIPPIIEKCISQADSAEPIEIEDTFNPYYLRGNFDGNDSVDYAVLVRKIKDKFIRGLLICKDSKEPFLYGLVSKSKVPFSNLNDDNFITDDWDILSKDEIKELPQFRDGTKLIEKAKGEVIGFYYEGGDFFVYWDGKTFRGI